MTSIDPMPVILSIIGLLQVISLAFGKWIHGTLIELIRQQAKMAEKFDNIPVTEITANRHKIAQLDKNIDALTNRVKAVELDIERQKVRCDRLHDNQHNS